MSTHDPISDLITRIRNAQMRNKSKVSTPGSKMRANVLEVLKSRATSAAMQRSSMPAAATSWRSS
jgi:ribosomal protein S8